MEPEKKGNGALVGAIIIVLILVLGGIYYWINKAEAPTENNTNDTSLTEDELGSIEADLNTKADLGGGVDTVE